MKQRFSTRFSRDRDPGSKPIARPTLVPTWSMSGPGVGLRGLAFLILVTSSANAQTPAPSAHATPTRLQTESTRRAGALFREGRAALKAEKYLEACSKFSESLRLEHAPGTVLNLADCEEKQGHLVSALALFRQVSRALPASDSRRSVS